MAVTYAYIASGVACYCTTKLSTVVGDFVGVASELRCERTVVSASTASRFAAMRMWD